MIVDFDDFHETNHRLDLLERLKDANPAFKMTAFAVPAWCPDEFLSSLPDWIEVVPHGRDHGGRDCSNPRECENWEYLEALDHMLSMHGRFVDGWKSPGWQISDGTYLALEELGWWVADQHCNDDRRPATLRVHCEGDGDHWHGHIQNVCGNGIEETWPVLLTRVREAESFEFISEVVARPLSKVAA